MDLGFVNRWTDARGWDMNCDPLKLSGELHSFFFIANVLLFYDIKIGSSHTQCSLTLSSTAPASIPNLSAIGTIRSGRLQVHRVKEKSK